MRIAIVAPITGYPLSTATCYDVLFDTRYYHRRLQDSGALERRGGSMLTCIVKYTGNLTAT